MKQLRIVLVRTQYPRNIGLVSRAMANFGAEKLILVQPQCKLALKARQGAAGGQGPLENATIYQSWEEFYTHEPEGLRLALSRRQGRRRPSVALPKLLKRQDVSFNNPVHLLLGPEDDGLNAEDLNLVHHLCYFDLPGEMKSMNLSHAAIVALQILSQHLTPFSPDNELATITNPEPALRRWLETLNFDLQTHTRWNALVMLQQLLMRAQPSADEWRRLTMIIEQTVRRLNEKNPK